ncbi:hypothetical protein LTR85_010321 [Meristemomyces frigidus]|nr:hypothetical protein LTR85_010321 [Meristemomyces frigidus]
MHATSVVAALVSLVAAANGLYFSVESLTATDKFDPATHSIDFTVSNPEACSGGSGIYYTKVTAGTYTSAASFSLDVWQAYVNELGDHNNATIAIASSSNSTSYACTSDAACRVCTESGSGGFNQTLQEYYGGADPVGAPIC